MPTYNEKTGFVVRNQSTGAPLTTATVQLRRGVSTIAMSHLGQGFYVANSVPRGRWEVWIDGVNSGMTHGVGVGKLEDIGHEVGQYAQSLADGWQFVPIDLSPFIRRDGTSVTTASIPFAEGASFGKAISVNSNTAVGYSLVTSVSGAQYSAKSSDTGSNGWRWGVRSTAAADFILVNDNLGTIPFLVSRADDSATFISKVNFPSSTASRASINIGAFGVTVTSPVDGDIWRSATDSLVVRMSSNTRTIAFLEKAQTWTQAQTGRSWALTSQSNTPTGTTYTWTLTSGNQLDLNLTSSTGAVTVTTASPTAGATSILRALGHGSATRQLTITQSGVTFVKAGVTSGASIVLDTIGISENACYRLHWITATLCFVDRVNELSSGGMTLSGHQNVVTPWSVGSGANFSSVSAGMQIDPVGTYGFWIKGNTLVEQASGQGLRVYRATSGATSEVCLPFALQDSLGNVEDYAEICGRIDSSTSGSEKGTMILEYKQNGSMVQGAFLNENGFTASQILASVTISSIYSGLRLNGVTSGTISNFLSHNGINASCPFFGGSATLGIDSSAGVTVPVDTTFLVVTSLVRIAFPRFFRTAISNAIGSSIVEIECRVDATSSPATYTFRNRTAFTLGAGGAFNSGNPLVLPIIP